MIEQIRIQNFKSIRDVTVDLSPVTVLIGRSGTGKSNFLRAIRFLRNYLQVGDAAVQHEGGWSKIAWFGQAEPLMISTRFRLPGYDVPFTYELTWGKVHPNIQFGRPIDERFMHGDQVVFEWTASDQGLRLSVAGETKKLPLSSESLTLRLSNFPTVTEMVLAYTALTTGIGWHDFPARVFVDAAPRARSQDAVSIEGLDDAANDYLKIVREITQNLRDQRSRQLLLARARKVNPTITSIEIDNVLKPTKVVVTHAVDGQRMGLELSQESDGFRRFYAHLLALYQMPSKLLLMFEEPENGIYPGALKELAEEFKRSQELGHGQVLFTTHSPQLLDGGLPPESIRWVSLDSHQTTCIAPLAAGEIEALRNHLLTPGELLTVTEPQVSAAPNAAAEGEASAGT